MCISIFCGTPPPHRARSTRDGRSTEVVTLGHGALSAGALAYPPKNKIQPTSSEGFDCPQRAPPKGGKHYGHFAEEAISSSFALSQTLRMYIYIYIYIYIHMYIYTFLCLSELEMGKARTKQESVPVRRRAAALPLNYIMI